MVEEGLKIPSENNGHAATPRHRLIVLGASNVAKSLEVLLEVAPQMIPAPLEVYAAIGRGRSYGIPSRFLCRGLPGILDSQLWPALEQVTQAKDAPPTETTAVITDIGNDLLYGQTVRDITQWVEQCIFRLRKTEARIALTGIPLSTVRSIDPVKYLAFRTMLFPFSRLQLQTVKERAEELNTHLQALSQAQDIVFVPQNPEWYALDPVHWKQAARPAVWHTILAALGHTAFDYRTVRSTFFHSMRHWRSRPAARTMFGIPQSKAQPSILRGDRLTVALY